MNASAKHVFYALCSDLVKSVQCVSQEDKALTSLKNRFHTWKVMFKNESSGLSEEKNRGLLGELYFIRFYLIPHYSVDIAVESWSGPNGTSKDFSKGSEWYEIKTTLTTASTVRISSISQLASNNPGFLGIVKLESMSERYEDGHANAADLFKDIIKLIESNETREEFISKVVLYGFDINDEARKKKYKVCSMDLYQVSGDFPRLKESDIKQDAISGVSYDLVINMIAGYKTEE
jgi:hypothetical protein